MVYSSLVGKLPDLCGQYKIYQWASFILVTTYLSGANIMTKMCLVSL